MVDRRRMWTDVEITLLLNVWSKDSIQRQLQGAHRNEVPYNIALSWRKLDTTDCSSTAEKR